MRTLRLFFTLITALCCSAALAQSPSLTIGDPAPQFVPEAWVKGTPVPQFEKGKIYVVEFWATWCGPCIASMPHLSDLADKMQGKAEFLSVNCLDRSNMAEQVLNAPLHIQRVTKFVTEHAATMRYNVCLDDAKDTIAKSWMTAAGQDGIPTTFIVDKTGRVAWIGHPMTMEEPLRQIVAGTFDTNAFKRKFAGDNATSKAESEKEAARQKQFDKAKQKVQLDIDTAAKAGSVEQFEKAVEALAPEKKLALMKGIMLAAESHPDFAIQVVAAKRGKVDGLEMENWCASLLNVVMSTKDKAVKQRALTLSADCVGKCPANALSGTAMIHAQTLYAVGKKTEALAYIAKARTALKDCEPAAVREMIGGLLDEMAKQMSN